MHLALETNSTKLLWQALLSTQGRSPQPPEANGGSGAADPPTLKRFLQFFSQKLRIFEHYGLNFCLKTRLK